MLEKIKKMNIDKKLWYILLLASFFILFKISQVDFLGDNTHYTIRSIAYMDFMFSDKQTTPLNWFDKFPWWANLAFHDHPMLLFFVQHIFLSISETILFAKLPYVLFSLGTIFLTYLMIREYYGEKVALWSSLFLSLNSHFLYNARAGFMEAGVIFFIALALYFFLKFLKDEKYWYYFGIALGLCFLAKYNTFFLIPTFFVYLLIRKREFLKNKKLYYSGLVAVLVFSPSIIYNIMMFKTTGHLDYQFSRLFHMDNPWSANNVGGFVNPISFLTALAKSVTFPYFFLSIVGLIYAIFFRKRMYLVGISLVFLTLFFCLTGAGIHHMNIYSIFLALPIGYLVVSVLSAKKLKIPKKVVKGSVFIFVFYLGLIAFNSHLTFSPVLAADGLTVSLAKSENFGIYQLDRYFEKLIKENNILSIRDGYVDTKGRKESLIRKYSTKPEALEQEINKFKIMIIYDDNLNWFVELWPIKRRRFYHNLPFLSTEELIRFAGDISIEKIFFVRATENTLLEGGSAWKEFPEKFQNGILDAGAEQIDSIYRSDGKEAFKVYVFDSKKEI
jgi:hypothetical protein